MSAALDQRADTAAWSAQLSSEYYADLSARTQTHVTLTLLYVSFLAVHWHTLAVSLQI